jgi:hypothetical protein
MLTEGSSYWFHLMISLTAWGVNFSLSTTWVKAKITNGFEH